MNAWIHGLRSATAIVLAAAISIVSYWAVATVHTRPTIAGETEVLFEASRIHDSLPLYIDPVVGAREYGSPPSRYLVTYPPLWSWMVSHAPSNDARETWARILCTFAWWGALGLFIWRGRPECRAQAIVAAAFFAGMFNLALFAESGRPDSIAILFAAIALSRSMRAHRVDAASAALFALAAWTKPTVLGLFVGALVAHTYARSSVRPAVVGASIVSVVVLVILERASGHTWFLHLVQSNMQPLSWFTWWEAMKHDAFFFIAPIAGALAIGWQRRKDPGVFIGLIALSFAFAWALFSRAKIGAATNYWMECSIGVVALASSAPIRFSPRGSILLVFALAQSLWMAVASIRSASDALIAAPRIDAFFTDARALCLAAPSDFVMSDDPAAELRVNGRIYTTAYQMIFMVFAHKYPVALWIEDIDQREVRCFIEHTKIMRGVPELSRALDEKFVAIRTTGDWTLFRQR